jgi:hypothetical protein
LEVAAFSVLTLETAVDQSTKRPRDQLLVLLVKMARVEKPLEMTPRREDVPEPPALAMK